MSQLCRLCLLKDDTMSAIFIDGKNSETADRIMACVSIEVSFFYLYVVPCELYSCTRRLCG